MSSDIISVELTPRKVVRKGLTGLRQDGQIPAVIHNHGKDSIHVQGDARILGKMYDTAGKSHPVEVKVGKEDFLTLIRDVDVEPTKQRLRHIVFQAIKRGEKVQAEVHVVLDGEIPAERNSLMVIKSLDVVEVEAMPSKLVDELKIDASVLVQVGDKITVADIKVPEGIVILTDADQGVAHVEMPKDQVAEADASAADLAADAETTGDEPEAIEQGKDDAAEGEASEESDKKESSEEQ